MENKGCGAKASGEYFTLVSSWFNEVHQNWRELMEAQISTLGFTALNTEKLRHTNIFMLVYLKLFTFSRNTTK